MIRLISLIFPCRSLKAGFFRGSVNYPFGSPLKGDGANIMAADGPGLCLDGMSDRTPME
jgi:hypothetical protein